MNKIPGLMVDPLLRAMILGKSIAGKLNTIWSLQGIATSTAAAAPDQVALVRRNLVSMHQILVAGKYTVGCHCNQLAGYNAATSYPVARVYVNGDAVGDQLTFAGGINNTTQYQELELAAGDIVQMYTWSAGTIGDTEGKITIQNGGYVPDFFA